MQVGLWGGDEMTIHSRKTHRSAFDRMWSVGVSPVTASVQPIR